ncbi:MAG TPA: hypothetical protein VKE96_14300 [Vicinamibacterales bacterium]|nr:hypothetical protein [Vicinamibacterales bacterium]
MPLASGARLGPLPRAGIPIQHRTGKKTPWRVLQPSDPAGLFWVGRMDGERDLFITHDGEAYAYMYNRVLSDLFLVDGLK